MGIQIVYSPYAPKDKIFFIDGDRTAVIHLQYEYKVIFSAAKGFDTGLEMACDHAINKLYDRINYLFSSRRKEWIKIVS